MVVAAAIVGRFDGAAALAVGISIAGADMVDGGTCGVTGRSVVDAGSLGDVPVTSAVGTEGVRGEAVALTCTFTDGGCQAATAGLG